MIVIVNFGGILLNGWEVPAEIGGGGEQSLDIKKFLGGARRIDAMGDDEDQIVWNARMRGANAVSRCRQFINMRKAGKAIPLTFDAFNYMVVIRGFRWKFKAPFEIEYNLSFEVISDNAAPTPSIIQTIDSLFGGSLADSLGISDILDDASDTLDDTISSLGLGDSLDDLTATVNAAVPGVVSGLNSLQQTASTVATITGNPAIAATLSSQIGSIQSIVQTAIISLNGQTAPLSSSLFGMSSSLPISTNISNLAGNASALEHLANLNFLTDNLSVMQKNLATVAQ